MKKQLIIIGIVAILVMIGLSGCNQTSIPSNQEKNKLIGTWKFTDSFNSTWFYNFFSNDTYNIMGYSGTYEIKNGKLILTSSRGFVTTFDYNFSNNDKTLTLQQSGTTGHDIFLTKQ